MVTEPALDRRRQVVVAGHVGDVDMARSLLDDDDARVRAGALGALHRCQELTVAELRGGLSDSDAVVRRRSVTIAATRTDGDLLGLLDDVDPTVIEVAAWACGERPFDDRIVERLIVMATEHLEPLCREAAVAALGALEATEAVPAIIAACTDKPAIRRRAVLALTPFDGPDVTAALQQALEDRDWQTRQAAEDLLA